MGCWSESCALSGLEIMLGEEDIYVALLKPSKYRERARWDIVIPPVKGTYDEYGGIDLCEDVPMLNMKKGDNWRPREDEWAEKGSPIYLNGAVVDSLPNLVKEFNWHGRTLEESYQHHLTDLHEKIKETTSLIESLKLKGAEDDGTLGDSLLEIKLSMIFGVSDSILPDARKIYSSYVNEGKEAEFFVFYKRAFMLQCAQVELRKMCVPDISGPQHSGEVALRQFYTTVSDILDARIEQFRIESESDD